MDITDSLRWLGGLLLQLSTSDRELHGAGKELKGRKLLEGVSHSVSSGWLLLWKAAVTTASSRERRLASLLVYRS